MTSRWHNLVSEAQFATDLTVGGLRRLCTVPTGGDPNSLAILSYDRTYPLHVGLLSYVSGLERLCKLTIACHGYAANGAFPPLRKYGHKIGGLLGAVESLDLEAVRSAKDVPPPRPIDRLDPTLTDFLERYASGPGRYEHLDSLWNGDAEVQTHETWIELSRNADLPKDVRDINAMRSAAVDALRDVCNDGGLETIADPYLNEMEPLVDTSIGVALALHRKASWVALTLDFVTYYTSQSLPIIGEALIDLRLPAEKFFLYSVARINDIECVEDELTAHFTRMKDRPEDDDPSEDDVFAEVVEDKPWATPEEGVF